ncbi:MAG: hypothetical protein A2Z66_11970 [Chloroflexi bacterium RBG_13_66_10]|nr:MAG: hypothetical protein A2Z66_11970 [Chloroflexi bacterium RBG_13_66_10]
MDTNAVPPRALFLSDEGRVLPDTLVCSGVLPGREPSGICPFSEAGRMPLPQQIGAEAHRSGPERGNLGDLAPPCALQALGDLTSFMGARSPAFPPDLQPLRVFKCRLMYLLVVPGLRDDRAGEVPATQG